MDDLRSKVQAHWQSFDALVDSQTGGNEAILRALDIFQSASSTFKAAVEEPQERLDASNTVTSESIPLDHDVTDFVPKGGVNATPNNGRRSYLRAEEGLALAREQLARNSETLSRMEEEIKGARRHIGELALCRGKSALHLLEDISPGAVGTSTSAAHTGGYNHRLLHVSATLHNQGFTRR